MVDYLFNLINGLAGKSVLLDWLMIVSAKYLVVVLAAFLIYLFIKEKKKFVFVFFGMLVSLGISMLIKFLYYTPRPFVVGVGRQLIKHVADSSFPSDHAVAFFSAAFALLFVKKWKAGIAFLIIALLVSFARIFTGLHYPVDMLGSILVSGIGVSLAYFFLGKKLN